MYLDVICQITYTINLFIQFLQNITFFCLFYTKNIFSNCAETKVWMQYRTLKSWLRLFISPISFRDFILQFQWQNWYNCITCIKKQLPSTHNNGCTFIFIYSFFIHSGVECNGKIIDCYPCINARCIRFFSVRKETSRTQQISN